MVKIKRLINFLNEDMGKIIMTPEIKAVDDLMNQSELVMKTAEDRFAKKEIEEPDMMKLKAAEMRKIADLLTKKADLMQVELNKKTP